MRKLTTEAVVKNVGEVIKFVADDLKPFNCSKNTLVEVSIAVDEIFSNIANYAYNQEVGMATVRTEILNDPLRIAITFLDQGKPFNPLAMANPNVNVPGEEYKIGGFGIFLVKESMDEVHYEYFDGQNVLTIYKNL